MPNYYTSRAICSKCGFYAFDKPVCIGDGICDTCGHNTGSDSTGVAHMGRWVITYKWLIIPVLRWEKQ